MSLHSRWNLIFDFHVTWVSGPGGRGRGRGKKRAWRKPWKNSCRASRFWTLRWLDEKQKTLIRHIICIALEAILDVLAVETSLVIFTDSDFTKALEGALRFFPDKWLKPDQKLCLKKLVIERISECRLVTGGFFIYQLLSKISKFWKEKRVRQSLLSVHWSS